MKRIFVVVEGETEERFLRQVIYNHFIVRGIHIEAQQWITNRKIGTKGGGGNYDLIENHIKRLISRYSNDQDVFISTMIDLYGFPRQGNTIYEPHVTSLPTGIEKAQWLEDKLNERIPHRNFIPYVQLHEFEALLLANPDSLAIFYPDKKIQISRLKNEISGLSPEEINETAENAPSKRIIRYLPNYYKQKTTAGMIAAQQTGLPYLRQKCPHFDEWITKMENV